MEEEEERKADVECRWIREAVRLVRLFLFVSLPRMLSLIPAHLVPISCPPSFATPQVLASEVKQNHACQRPGTCGAVKPHVCSGACAAMAVVWCVEAVDGVACWGCHVQATCHSPRCIIRHTHVNRAH